MPTLKPIRDRVVVKRIEAQEKTKSGLVLPDTAKEQPQEGKVVAVGRGRLLEDGSEKAPHLKHGDHVFYGKYAGTEVTIDGEDFLILREEDILAVVA